MAAEPIAFSSRGRGRSDRLRLDQRARSVLLARRGTALNCDPNCNPAVSSIAAVATSSESRQGASRHSAGCGLALGFWPECPQRHSGVKHDFACTSTRHLGLCWLPCGHSHAWGWRGGHVHSAGHPRSRAQPGLLRLLPRRVSLLICGYLRSAACSDGLRLAGLAGPGAAAGWSGHFW